MRCLPVLMSCALWSCAALVPDAAHAAASPVVAHAADAAGAGTARLRLEVPSGRVDGGEFSRRLLSPLAADDLARFLQVDGRRLGPEAFTPGADSVDVYVPAHAPVAGYGLIVFVPPMREFVLPRDWKRTLDARGLIFVALRDAGNDADVIGRRIPLVLHAQHLVAARHPLDPSRIYVAGFSGGARLAQRVATAWPDLFSGSLQFAGSVVVGESRLPPPPAELMDLLQSRSRFVLVSGGIDLVNRRNDALAAARLRALCVPGVHTLSPPRLDHWVPDGRVFARAVGLLEAPVEAGTQACAPSLLAEVARRLDAVAAAVASGDDDAATTQLLVIDDRYGGLAAPRSLELARRLLERRAQRP